MFSDLIFQMNSSSVLSKRYLDSGRICDERVAEQFTRILVGPVLRDRIALCVEVFQDGLNILVLLDQRDGTSRPNVLDRVAVVASQKNTQVNELV